MQKMNPKQESKTGMNINPTQESETGIQNKNPKIDPKIRVLANSL